MEISSNLYRDNLITSTVDLDNQSVVSDRMIDLEFKEVLKDSNKNNVQSYQVFAAKYKEVEIYSNYKSVGYRPIGKGSYAVVGKGIEVSKSQINQTGSYTQSKIERNYQAKNLTPTGSFIDKRY